MKSETTRASQGLVAPPTYPGYQNSDGPGLREPFALEVRVMTRASVAREYSFARRESVFSVTSGSYEIYSHPDGRTMHIYYIIPHGQKYWWILDKPAKTGNTVDELEKLLRSIYYAADRPPVHVPPSMLVAS